MLLRPNVNPTIRKEEMDYVVRSVEFICNLRCL